MGKEGGVEGLGTRFEGVENNKPLNITNEISLLQTSILVNYFWALAQLKPQTFAPQT